MWPRRCVTHVCCNGDRRWAEKWPKMVDDGCVICADDREVETPNKSIVKTRKKGKEKPKGGWEGYRVGEGVEDGRA
jgi:hypothetical protein